MLEMTPARGRRRAEADEPLGTSHRATPPWRRAVVVGGEVLSAFLGATVLLLLARGIDVDPLDRVGQVSGLAAIGLRFTALGLVILAAVVVSRRWRSGAFYPVTARFACAAVAGLTSGFVGSAILVALHGTSWPLFAGSGDAGRLAQWVGALQAGEPAHESYPPLALYAMAWYSDLTGAEPPSALRAAQILGTAFFGPVAYLAWRMLLRPTWALVAGAMAAVVLVDPYKPYTPLVLAVLIPALLVMLTALRRVTTMTWTSITVRGGLLGILLGVLFLTYSGWFVWSAPGAVAAVGFLFPWRHGLQRGLAFLGVTVGTFAVIAHRHVLDLIEASGSVVDDYFYFDVLIEPAYIAMWRGDMPGNTGPWPPPGELGGVGVFSAVLLVGIGVAIWLYGRRTAVIALALLLSGAWVMRFWFAAQMYETQSVQLYPRTTPQILYCSLLLVLAAFYFSWERVRQADLTVSAPWRAVAVPGKGRHGAGPVLGTLCAVLLLGVFAGSSTADRYMPREEDSPAYLAYAAHMVRQVDGTCPAYSRPDRCVANVTELRERSAGSPDQAD